MISAQAQCTSNESGQSLKQVSLDDAPNATDFKVYQGMCWDVPTTICLRVDSESRMCCGEGFNDNGSFSIEGEIHDNSEMSLNATNLHGPWPLTLHWDEACSQFVGFTLDNGWRWHDATFQRLVHVDEGTCNKLPLWSLMLRVSCMDEEFIHIILDMIEPNSFTDIGWRDREDMVQSFFQDLTLDMVGAVARGLPKQTAEEFGVILGSMAMGADFHVQFDFERAKLARSLPLQAILSVLEVQERLTKTLGVELPQTILEQVRNDVHNWLEPLTVGSDVVVLRTQNTERRCPELIGKKVKIVTDAQDDQPYQIQGSSSWLYAFDVQKEATNMRCSKFHRLRKCIVPQHMLSAAGQCLKCKRTNLKAYDEVMFCAGGCKVYICNSCCNSMACAILDECAMSLKQSSVDDWLRQQMRDSADSLLELECPICFEDMVEDDLVHACRDLVGRPLHTFHKQCLRDWLKLCNECPSCRHSPVADYSCSLIRRS